MRLTFMGSGTSHGIPVIACNCAVCKSMSKKNKRFRSSVYICQKDSSGKETNIVVDTGPEFRIQALKYKLKSLNAVLLTHSHADHLNGLDDLRIFSHTFYSCNKQTTSTDYPETNGEGLPIYANENTIQDAKNRFDYIFKNTQLGGGKPKLCFIDVKKFVEQTPLKEGLFTILPIPILHGELPVTGWLISCIGTDGKKHSIAYLTDCNFICDESINLINRNCGILDHVVIDALRVNIHSTHCNYASALEYADRLCGKHTWFTHICHDASHSEIKKYIKIHLRNYKNLYKIVCSGGSVEPAYDGLKIKSGE